MKGTFASPGTGRRVQSVRRDQFGLTSRRRLAFAAAALLVVAATLSGLAVRAASASGAKRVAITVWAHDGQPAENASIKAAVDGFNASQTKVTARLTLVPANTYTQTISTTNASNLPDVFEFDGPTMSFYAWTRKLAPIKGLVPASVIANQTSSVIGQDTYRGQLMGLAIIDSGLGLYGNRKLLTKAGVKWPTTWSRAWSAQRFLTVLQEIAKVTPGGKALDINEEYFPGEWESYAFLPILNSTGNKIIANNSANALKTPAVMSALTDMQSWLPYVDPNTDGNAFVDGRVALTWNGHWNYPTFSKALGRNLVVIPLPNFGRGAKTGQGSWGWGISADSSKKQAAGQFLAYLMSDKIVRQYTTGDGAPPGTKSVLASSPLYKVGGPLHLFAQALLSSCKSSVPSLSCVAVPRPLTAAYPVISLQLQQLFTGLVHGGSVKSLLSTAVNDINLAYQENGNYSS